MEGSKITVYRDGKADAKALTIDGKTVKHPDASCELKDNGDLVWSFGYTSRKEDTYETKDVFLAFSNEHVDGPIYHIAKKIFVCELKQIAETERAESKFSD